MCWGNRAGVAVPRGTAFYQVALPGLVMDWSGPDKMRCSPPNTPEPPSDFN